MRLLQVPSYGHSQQPYCRCAFWHVRNALRIHRFCSDKIQWFLCAKRKMKPHHVRRPLELSYESNTPTGCRNGGKLSSCTLSIAAACERFLNGSRHSGMKRIALPAPFGRRLMLGIRHGGQRTLYAVVSMPLLVWLRYLYPVASAGLPASWTSTT
jgi:hypothetical protein